MPLKTTPDDFFQHGIDVDVCKVCGLANDHMTNCAVPIVERRLKELSERIAVLEEKG